MRPEREIEPEMEPSDRETLSLVRPAETENVSVIEPDVSVTVAEPVVKTTAYR